MRAEVPHRQYLRPAGGGLCIAAGNGILPGTPLDNVEVFLDEALRYGAAHRQQMARQLA